MVSVIIPYYNNSKEIKRSLSSVFAQTYQDFEIILINDASPDWEEGLPLINAFNDDRIKIISHTSNKNGSAARNTGINAAIGEYVAFLDADDEWLANHLKNLLVVQKENNAELVYSSCTVHSSNNFIYSLPKHSIAQSKNLGEYLFCENGFVATPSLLIKKSVAQKAFFNEKLIRHQDYDFLLRLEDNGVVFFWSKEPSVIVHWENNNLDAKGGTWKYSEIWIKENKKYLTPKARTCFILKFVVMRLLQRRDVKTGIFKFFKYCRLWHISPKKYYFLISTILFGRIILLKK